MTKRLIIFFIFLLIFCNSIVADTTYTEVGNSDSQFNLGTGQFNENLLTVSQVTRTLNNPQQVPLVSDLDNDGTNEIIVLDNNIFRLFQNKELDIVDSFIANLTNESYHIVYDIDGDNLSEIIAVSHSSNVLNIIEYNGTHFYLQNELTVSGTHITGDIIVKCRDVNDCIVLYMSEVIVIGTVIASAQFFNSTHLGDELNYSSDGVSVRNAYCFPKIATVSTQDYDSDTDIEYIVSFIDVGVTNPEDDENLKIAYLNVNSSKNVILEQMITETELPDFSNLEFTQGCQGQNWGRFITSPLVFDIDGSPSNGLETVVGFMIDNNEYEIFSYNSDGSFLDDYPEIVDSDGIIISNVFLSNYFPDTGTVDFCVMGYQDNLGIIDLTCASEQTTETPETNEITMDITNLYNVSGDFGIWNVIAHSAQHSNAITDESNLHEIVTSYGIIRVDKNSCSIFGNCDMSLIFENPQNGGDDAGAVVISIDTEKTGFEDLLVMTSTNLWYIDDLFSNSNAVVNQVTTNPSILSTIRVNETVFTTIQCIDNIDNDNVQAKLISYLNDNNEQNTSWTSLSGTGTVFPLTFEANKTINGGLVRFMCRDSEHNESDNFTRTFSVAINGIVFGDAIFDSGELIVEEVTFTGEHGTNFSSDDNLVRETIIEMSNAANITPTIFMLIFIFIVDMVLLVMFFVMKDELNIDGILKLTLAMIFLVDFFILISFAYLSILSTAFIVTLFFLLILFGFIFVMLKLNPNAS